MTDYKIPIEYKSIPVKDLNIYIGESTLSRTGFFPSGTIGDTTITINGQASIDGLSESYTATRVEENDLILDGTHFYGYVYHINRIPIYIYVTNSRFDSGVYTRKQLFVLPVNVTSIYDECGKGVIYYMKDEYNNEAPYDFKNILYTRDANTLYTFDNADGTDSSKKGYAWGNVIKPHYVSNKYMLNWIRLWGSYHSNNVFGPNCHNITLNDESCSNNIFGSCCAEITLAGRNECNTFGNNCFDITLGGEDSGMSFGNYCSNISIDITESRKITFLSGCTDIEVTDYVAQNFFQ